MKVLGALITHVGSGISHEVSSAMDVMVLLASKYSQELIPLSSHITGVLVGAILMLTRKFCHKI